MKNRQWRYYLLYWLMVFFPAHYLGAQGIAYQSVEVDSLINPPLLKEGGEMFSFDSLRVYTIPMRPEPTHFRFAMSVARMYGSRR